MKTNKEAKRRDEIKAWKSRSRRQAAELGKAGREILRLLRWKALHGGVTKREIMTAAVWSIVLAMQVKKS